MSTVDALDRYQTEFLVVDAVTSCLFACEYLLRAWSAVEYRRFRELGPWLGRLQWMLTWEALLDLASTLPFFIDLLDGGLHDGPFVARGSFVPLTWLRIFRI